MNRYRRGQVLVLTALALFALVAFVALAVDVGNVYRERRHMQNAADAGALAGAREICFGDPTQAEARAREYAVDRNGAQGSEITVSGGFTVTVVATETVKTFFAGVLGFNEVPVAADATAVCGKAAAASGLWPVGFDKRRWQYAEDQDAIKCGTKIIIWEESGRADCENYNCCVLFDKHGDILEFLPTCGENWEPEIYPLDWQTWVDFSAGVSGEDPCESTGCGANEVTDRIEGETNQGDQCESFVQLPDCFAVPQGVKSNAWQTAEAAAGRIVKVPLYDVCRSGTGDGSTDVLDPIACDPENNPEARVCTMDKDPGANCTNERYWIDTLICLQIGWYDGEAWHASAYLAPFTDPDEHVTPGDLIKVMVATVPCDEDGKSPAACATSSGWSTGEIPQPGDIKAVSLIK